MRGTSSHPNRFNREFQHKKKDGNVYHVILIISWVMIVGWVGFLVYCWYAGAIDKEKLQNLANNVDTMISETEKTLLVKSGLLGNHNGLKENKPATVVVQTDYNSPEHKDDVWIVFSTDCTPYQDWQTLLLFHSAKVVGQKGRVVRIASGCSDNKKEELSNTYKMLYGNRFGAHFTPDFKKDPKTNRSYDFYNKPWGLKHWLQYAEPPIPDNAIIALLDPDMVLIRPITPFIKANPHIVNKRIPREEIMERIDAGFPVAQTYGLGAPWTNDNHKHFKRGKICGEGSPCLLPNMQYGEMHYSVGPPYVVHKQDFIRIADSWTRLVPRVYDDYPYLLAEMYAYSMAAAHEKLPHLQVDHYMVSNVDAYGEGWPWVDDLPEVCVPPEEDVANDRVTYYPGLTVPNVVHFCQSFRAGEFGFFKRRVPKNIFSCEHDLLLEPPRDLAKADYIIKKDQVRDLLAMSITLPFEMVTRVYVLTALSVNRNKLRRTPR